MEKVQGSTELDLALSLSLSAKVKAELDLRSMGEGSGLDGDRLGSVEDDLPILRQIGMEPIGFEARWHG